MFTRDDLLDALRRHLAGSPGVFQAGRAAGVMPPPGKKPLKGRVFITEREIRDALKPGETRVQVPAGAIVSPLALEWLQLKGISVDFS